MERWQMNAGCRGAVIQVQGCRSAYFYGELGATTANVMVGLLSTIVDNIPVTVAVLEMNPPMDQLQWLLVTMTAGIGGSLY